MKSSRNRSSRIDKLLTRGTVEVIDRNHLGKALKSRRRLRVKLGIDPTSADLHLGHAVVLRKLKEFQDLGHKIVLIIGDFTATIGDLSGNVKARPPLTVLQIKKNMKDYVRQAGKIIDVKKAEINYNSKWLGKLNAREVVKLLGMVSANHILERDDFEKRFKEHKSVGMHELLYPIYQAYDSVAVKADVEIGGTDQTFNLLMGRELMGKMAMKPQNILTVPLLEGTDGKQKMSKSLGNYIGLDDSPDDMFYKVMHIGDKQISKYFSLCTDVEEKEIEKYRKAIRNNPLESKRRLAKKIVQIYHGENVAEKALNRFNSLYSLKNFSIKLDELLLPRYASLQKAITGVGALRGISNSAARRLIIGGGVSVNKKKITDPRYLPKEGDVLEIGKKIVRKVTLAN